MTNLIEQLYRLEVAGSAYQCANACLISAANTLWQEARLPGYIATREEALMVAGIVERGQRKADV